MSDIADRYDRLAAAFTDTIAAVPKGSWGAPSPCEGWSARDVVGHVVSTEWDFLARQELTPEGVTLPDDPLAAWPVVRERVHEVLHDPSLADRSFDGFFGPTSIGATIDRFYAMDLVVHRWDLARATGLADHEPMSPDEVDRLLVDAQAFGDAARQPGVFGPEIEVPAGASPQDRLLGFVGRRP